MKRRLLCLLILVLGIFIITGCKDSKKSTVKKAKAAVSESKISKKTNDENSDENKKEESKEDTVVGVYEIIQLKDDDVTYDKKIIDSLNLDYYFEVKDDNTAIMRFADQEEHLTYDDKNFQNEKEKIEYKYEKGKLTLSNEDTILTFKKK